MENEPSFEEALTQLEEIVNSLETGKLSLDQSLKRFEEGIRLSRLCNKKLAETQQKVEKLVEKDGMLSSESMSDYE
ncbi:MAG: exodeoxyribonuclease VII small subunit [Methanomassiliicoccales archaeon]|nr:MAG: exodeoxyribonuclease VII small subunit [Methanomassiliicoccales archaeon]